LWEVYKFYFFSFEELFSEVFPICVIVGFEFSKSLDKTIEEVDLISLDKMWMYFCEGVLEGYRRVFVNRCLELKVVEYFDEFC
jgi:hypothetical protein